MHFLDSLQKSRQSEEDGIRRRGTSRAEKARLGRSGAGTENPTINFPTLHEQGSFSSSDAAASMGYAEVKCIKML